MKLDRKYQWMMNRNVFNKEHNYHRQYYCFEHNTWRISNFFDEWIVMENIAGSTTIHPRKFKKFESAVKYAEKKIDKNLMAG